MRTLAAVPVLGLVLAASACGSSPTSTPSAEPSASASSSSSTSASGSSRRAECTEQAILSALPGGATMIKFDCADVSGTEWAAAQVDPGNTVFFLQWNGSAWDAEDSDSVCGTASAGLPEVLLAYCQAASPSAAPSSSPSSSASAPSASASATS